MSIAQKLSTIAENQQRVYDAGFAAGAAEGGGGCEKYSGDYEITPTASEQVLKTAQKLLEEDVTVRAIPYSEVSNNANGTTVCIG